MLFPILFITQDKPFLDLLEQTGRAIGANGDGRVPVTKDVPLAV
jgi:hypothetical protein